MVDLTFLGIDLTFFPDMLAIVPGNVRLECPLGQAGRRVFWYCEGGTPCVCLKSREKYSASLKPTA